MDVVINGWTDTIPSGSAPLLTQQDYLLNFLMLTGHDPNNPPLGDLLRRYHQLEGEWLVAVPVYWQATHNDAMILAQGPDLQLTEEESQAWFNAVGEFLKEHGILLHYHNSSTWLLKNNRQAPIARPAIQMQNQSMMPALEEMDPTLYWQGLLTEVQMFLYTHPLNQHRGDQCPVNGLWIYGGGSLDINKLTEISTDNEALIAAFPNNIKRLNREIILQDNAVLLISDLKKTNLNDLPESMSDFPLQWFWNNLAYKTAKITLWTRFWRYLTHADKTKRT